MSFLQRGGGRAGAQSEAGQGIAGLGRRAWADQTGERRRRGITASHSRESWMEGDLGFGIWRRRNAAKGPLADYNSIQRNAG